MTRPPDIHTVIGTFASSGQALRAVDELAREGIADEQMSILVWRGASRLTAAETAELRGFAASGGLLGAVLAALTARSDTSLPEVDALGTGPLLEAIAGVERRPAAGLGESLILLGLDPRAAEAVDEAFRAGDIVLGVDTPDDALSGVAARTFVRQGARTRAGVGASTALVGSDRS